MMMDQDHTLRDLETHKECIDINFESFKQSCTTKEPLRDMLTLYQLITKLLFTIEHYDQQTKAYYNSTWVTSLLGFFSFNRTLDKAALKINTGGKSSTQLIKTTLYTMLYQRINQQISALQASIEKLLVAELPNLNAARKNVSARSWVELSIIETFSLQIRWVQSYLELCKHIQSARPQTFAETQAESHRAEKFYQIRKLFHALYVKSMKNLLAIVMDKLVKLTSEHQPLYFRQIVDHINYIQNYAAFCVLPDSALHTAILTFNHCVLDCLGQDYTQLAIVYRPTKNF